MFLGSAAVRAIWSTATATKTSAIRAGSGKTPYNRGESTKCPKTGGHRSTTPAGIVYKHFRNDLVTTPFFRTAALNSLIINIFLG